ncbi:Alkaline nuclease [Labeo rohita]|uniref:Alkaline nuclease n=1 Tax=Labeo rohita TaxID=84645 RepID=A0ABQ8L092_LABRO|nr:Alkaline nuclease [Labeo rohita]
MAGIAESFTHVGALLFKIEAAVQIRGTKTVTDVPAYWMMPANVDKVQAEVGYKIDFSSGAAKRVALDKCISGEIGMSGIHTCLGSTSHYAHEPTLSDLSPLLQILARQVYVTLTAPQNTHLKVEQCGFIIYPSFPEVGASPDGLIQCTCCGKGCLEIKCTIKHSDSSILQTCADDSNFCLQVTDGKLQLKQTHKYYSQVQTQMFVTDSEFCDFVVLTAKDCTVVRVLPDADYWMTLLKGTGVLLQSFTT